MYRKPYFVKTPRYGKRCLGKDIFVSNNTRETNLNNNDLIIGSSGSNKTGSIIYPQIKTLSDSSLIVADSKHVLYGMFKTELQRRGYKVLLLDFVNPEQSCIYNPLDYVRKRKDGSYNELDIMKISGSLISNLEGDDPFWEIQGRAVLDFFISYTLEATPEEYHDMYTVCCLYREFTRQGEDNFKEWIRDHRCTFVAKRYAQIKNMQTAEKMWSSILGFVNVALYPFDVDILHDIFDIRKGMNGGTFKERLRIESLGQKKTVLFLNISDVDHSIDNLVNLFYSQALQTLVAEADKHESGRLNVPCRIIFDDFASGTIIPDFDKIISVIRSRDIWVTISIQSLSQLESLYSHAKSLTILNNCDHLVYMGSNDLTSAEYLGTRAGKVPEEILAMDRRKEYFIEGGKKAILVDKLPPYAYKEEEVKKESEAS